MPPPTGGLSHMPDAHTRYASRLRRKYAKGETMVLLVRVDPTENVADHIPNTLGQPLCKIRLDRSVWQIKECPVDEARVCHRCTVVLAKMARS